MKRSREEVAIAKYAKASVATAGKPSAAPSNRGVTKAQAAQVLSKLHTSTFRIVHKIRSAKAP